jgi:hypothetical protein
MSVPINPPSNDHVGWLRSVAFNESMNSMSGRAERFRTIAAYIEKLEQRGRPETMAAQVDGLIVAMRLAISTLSPLRGIAAANEAIDLLDAEIRR